MSDERHPYRPAFVELSESVFEVAKALGEAAVAKAQQPPPPPVQVAPRKSSLMETLEFAGKRIMDGRSARVCWWYSPVRDSVEFSVQCTACDHPDYTKRGEIEAEALRSFGWDKRAFFDLVYEKLLAEFIPHPHMVIER